MRFQGQATDDKLRWYLKRYLKLIYYLIDRYEALWEVLLTIEILIKAIKSFIAEYSTVKPFKSKSYERSSPSAFLPPSLSLSTVKAFINTSEPDFNKDRFIYNHLQLA